MNAAAEHKANVDRAKAIIDLFNKEQAEAK